MFFFFFFLFEQVDETASHITLMSFLVGRAFIIFGTVCSLFYLPLKEFVSIWPAIIPHVA
jgi:hypothetical protein